MAAATSRLVLGPGEASAFSVTFDHNKLSPGRNERWILLSSNDPAHPRVKAAFVFVVDQLVLPGEIAVLPRSVDYGRLSASAIAAKPLTFIVKIPTEDRQGEIAEVTAEPSTPLLRIVRHGPTTQVNIHRTDIPSSVIIAARNIDAPAVMFEYEATWIGGPPKGTFNPYIRFQVASRSFGIREMIVRISGECVRPR